MTYKEFMKLPSVRALSGYAGCSMTDFYKKVIHDYDLDLLEVYKKVEDYAINLGLFLYPPNARLRNIRNEQGEQWENSISEAHKLLARYIIITVQQQRKYQERHERWAD